MPRVSRCIQVSLLLSFFILGFAGPWTPPASAQESQDVVYLKDGSVIRGTIVEQVPGESILIETVDGNRFRYSMEEILRIAKELPPKASSPQLVQSTKSPGTAWALSFLLPGAGQFYNGDTSDGFWMLLGHVVFSAWFAEEAQCIGSECDDTSTGLAALLLLANWVSSQVDAYQGAKRINAGLPLNADLGLGLELSLALEPRAMGPFGSRHAYDVRLLTWSR